MKSIKKNILILLVLLLSLTGCAKTKNDIAYTVYPIEYLLDEVGGEYVETHSISNNELVIRSQISADFDEVLKESKILFTMGNLEPYFDVYRDSIDKYDLLIKDLTAKSGIFEFARFSKTQVNGGTVYVKSPYYEGAKFNTIDLYAKDPYLWLDPITMTSMAKQVRDYLISVDPDRTNYYEENYHELEFSLAQLDAQYIELREQDRDIKIATMTPSFGIWQKSYGIQVYPIILSKYGVMPTIDQLELIKQRLIADKVQYIATEPGLPDDISALCEEIAEELDLTIIELHSLSYLSEEDREKGLDYMQVMLRNLEVLENLEY